MIFEQAGDINTAKTLEIAMQTARERGVRHIVVASSTGKTALQLANDNGIQIVCVGQAYGFPEDGKNEITDEMMDRLHAKGVKTVFASHVLSGVERGISSKLGGAYPAEIIAHTLRMFGQGTKVCVEIGVMALDSGAIPHAEPVIAVGGSHGGADTAILLSPAHAAKIFDTKIHEIICKPNL